MKNKCTVCDSDLSNEALRERIRALEKAVAEKLCAVAKATKPSKAKEIKAASFAV